MGYWWCDNKEVGRRNWFRGKYEFYFSIVPACGTQLWAQGCGLRDTDLGVTSIKVVHEVMGMNSSLGKKRE